MNTRKMPSSRRPAIVEGVTFESLPFEIRSQIFLQLDFASLQSWRQMDKCQRATINRLSQYRQTQTKFQTAKVSSRKIFGYPLLEGRGADLIKNKILDFFWTCSAKQELPPDMKYSIVSTLCCNERFKWSLEPHCRSQLQQYLGFDPGLGFVSFAGLPTASRVVDGMSPCQAFNALLYYYITPDCLSAVGGLLSVLDRLVMPDKCISGVGYPGPDKIYSLHYATPGELKILARLYEASSVSGKRLAERLFSWIATPEFQRARTSVACKKLPRVGSIDELKARRLGCYGRAHANVA